jgi:hypothetical protein
MHANLKHDGFQLLRRGKSGHFFKKDLVNQTRKENPALAVVRFPSVVSRASFLLCKPFPTLRLESLTDSLGFVASFCFHF